jgi:FMN phosphatase YigB (HAD superfamily)
LEITLDLIKKMATLHGENEIDDPAKWYITEYGRQPDYSDILDELTKTPAERNNLLKAYFEPSEDETDILYRKPTKAHKAIAQLIKNGYIRIVITTNFDRLLESALAEIGVIPKESIYLH